MRCCGMNPRLGVLIIAILGITIHGLVLAWGVYANKILYIMIPSGLTCLAYVYLFFPLGVRRHRAYLPFVFYTFVIMLGICGFLGYLIYTQIQWPDSWKTELVKMMDGIDNNFDFNTVNYSYMGTLAILFFFNFLGVVTALIAYRYELERRTQRLVLPQMSEFDSGLPYTNLDVNGPSGGEQLWTVKL